MSLLGKLRASRDARRTARRTQSPQRGRYSGFDVQPLESRLLLATAHFSGSMPYYVEGSTFSANVSATDLGSETIQSWVVYWGDGSSTTLGPGAYQTTAHVYREQGTYSAYAIAYGSVGYYYSQETVTIPIANVPPSLSVARRAAVDEGAEYALQLSSADPGNDTVSSWDLNWGDGSATRTANPRIMRGAGAGVGGTADSFRYAYRTLAGDGTVVARISNLPLVAGGANPGALAGVTIRSDSTPGAANVLMGLRADGNAVFQSRAMAGGDTAGVFHPGFGSSAWVKLVRSGNLVHGYTSPNGLSWVHRGSVAVSMMSTVQVGLAVTSTKTTVIFPTFDNIAVTDGGTFAAWTEVDVARPAGSAAGSSTPLAPGTAIVTHAYPDGPASYPISATATDEDGTWTAHVNSDSELGGGVVVTDFGTPSAPTRDFGRAGAIQADGRVLVAGESNGNFAVARYLSSGALDTGFNPNGVKPGTVTTDFASTDGGNAVVVQPDQKIIVAGVSGGKIALARYLPDGSLDTGFGDSGANGQKTGKKTTDISTTVNDVAKHMLVQPDGQILIVGSSGSNFALVRYNPDGSPDTTFGDPIANPPGSRTGIKTTDFNSTESIAAVALLADNRIVVGGTTANNFVIARYNADGSLDDMSASDSTSGDRFGPASTPGRVVTDFGATETVHALAVQPDGRFVLAGTTNGGGVNFALARYNIDGSLDNGLAGDATAGDSFGNLGKATVDFGGVDQAYGLAVQSDGRILVAGYTSGAGTGVNFAAARLDPTGALDGSFGLSGRVTTGIGVAGSPNGGGLVVRPDGRIVIVGHANSDANANIAYWNFSLAAYLSTNYVEVVNVAPTVSIDPVMGPTIAGNEVNLTGTVSDPGWADTHTYQWKVYDGTTLAASSSGSGAAPRLLFTPRRGGSYIVELTVIDDDGGVGTAQPYTLVVGAPDVEAGLLAHWKLDEGSGLNPVDATGNNHHGVLRNGTEWGRGVAAGGLAFDGVDDEFLAPTVVPPAGSTAFSVAFWMKPSSLTTSTNSSGTQRVHLGPAESPAFQFETDPSGHVWFGTDWRGTSAPVMSAGEWQHFAFTFENDTGKLYKNGTLIAVEEFMPAPAGWQGLHIDRAAGAVDDVRVYSVALAPERVAAISDFGTDYQSVAGAMAWVHNNVEFMPYRGYMKSPQATADTKAGNAWDQAALLARKLTEAGVTAYVHTGRVSAAVAEVERWLGVKDSVAANTALAWAKLNPVLIQDPTVGLSFEFGHAWVSASLGGTGLPVLLDPSWKFKDLQPGISGISTSVPWATPITGPTTGDELVKDLYLSPVVGSPSEMRRQTPLEFYEEQVAAELRTLSDGSVSLADVPYDGPIIARDFWKLPSALPVKKISEEIPVPLWETRHRVRVTLSEDVDSPQQEVISVDAPGRYVRIQLAGTGSLVLAEVLVTNGNGGNWILQDDAVRPGVSVSQSSTFVDFNSAPQIDGSAAKAIDGDTTNDNQDDRNRRSITLHEASPWWEVDLGQSRAINNIRIWNANATGPRAKNYYVFVSDQPFPNNPAGHDDFDQIRLNPAIQSFFIGDRTLFQYDLDVPSHGSNTVTVHYDAVGDDRYRPELRLNGISVANVGPGANTIGRQAGVVLALDHFDPHDDPDLMTSDLLADRATIVSNTMEGKAGVPIGIGLGGNQVSERMLLDWQADLHQRALIASTRADVLNYQDRFLGMAAMKFFHDVHEQRDHLAGLVGALNLRPVVDSGITLGGLDVTLPEPGSYKWDLPYPIVASETTTDNRNISLHLAPIEASASSLQKDWHALDTYNWSAIEHHFLEELTNAQSVSTVKGLQWAKLNGIGIVTVSKFDAAGIERPQSAWESDINWLFSLDDQEFPLESPYSANARSLIRSDVFAGFTVTAPVRRVNLGWWSGAVWMREKSGSAAALILRNAETVAHGGALTQVQQIKPERPAEHSGLQAIMGDPVNMVTGGLVHDETDFAIPNIGVPLNFGRHYDSLFAPGTANGPRDEGFGVGWLHTYSDFLVVNGGQVTWTTATGEKHLFNSNGTSVYTNPGNLFGTLTRIAEGEFTYRELNGLTRHFKSNNPGVNHRLRLEDITDRNGNRLRITYVPGHPTWVAGVEDVQSVLDPLVPDRTITFQYNLVSGQVDSIVVSDFEQRSWTYHFEWSGGEKYLSRVEGPADGHTPTPLSMRYEYHPAGTRLAGLMHKIVDEVDGGEHVFEYYPNRRVFRNTDSESSLNGAQPPATHLRDEEALHQEHFSYDLYHAATTHRDARGNETVENFNKIGLTVKTINPDRTFRYNSWGIQSDEVDKYKLYGTFDDLGRVENFDYDSKGNVNYHLSRDGVVSSYTYHPTFNGLATASIGDRHTSSTYDDSNGDLRQTDVKTAVVNGNPVWSRTTYTYPTPSRGLPESVTTPRGNLTIPADSGFTTYFDSYHPSGRPLVVRTALSQTTNTYDGRGNLQTTFDGTSSVDGVQRVMTHVYDVYDRPVEEMSPRAFPWEATTSSHTVYVGGDVLEWDANHPWGTPMPPPTRVLDYDRMERLVRTTHIDGTFTTSKYDAAGNVVETTDGLGRTTKFVYDSRNRLIQTLYPDGTTTRVRLDGGGRTLVSFDPLGLTTTTAYDKGDRPVSVTNAIGQVTTYAYDTPTKDLTSVTDVRGTTTHKYDSMGRVTETRAPEGVVTTTEYDANGNTTRAVRYETTGIAIPTDPRSIDPARQRVTETEYDSLDRPIRVWDANHPRHGTDFSGSFRTFYDGGGRVERTVDQLGRETVLEFDGVGRLHKETLPDPDGAAPTLAAPQAIYEYDNNGNVRRVTRTSVGGTREHVETYDYDIFNRQTFIHDAAGGHIETRYDPAGQVAWTTNRFGHATRFGYDALGRQTWEQLPDPDRSPDQLPDGPKVGLVRQHRYDAAGNRTETSESDETLPHDQTVTQFVYDRLHRLIRTILPDPDGAGLLVPQVTRNVYDAQNNLERTIDAANQATVYTHDALARQKTVTAPDPDGNGPLQAPVTQSFYDSLGNVASVTDALGRTTTYAYDKLDRKIKETGPDPDGAGATHAAPVTHYEFDAVGNLLSVVSPRGAAFVNPATEATDLADVRAKGLFTTVYEYDALDRRTKEILADPDRDDLTTDGTLLAPTTVLRYDEFGNVERRSDGSTDVAAVGRPTTVGNTWIYEYDGLNRVTADTNDAGHSRIYTYDGGPSTGIGWIDTIADRTGKVRTFFHDNQGRLTQETWSAQNCAPREIRYDYDTRGRLQNVKDLSGGPFQGGYRPISEYTYSYDFLDRVKSVNNHGRLPLPENTFDTTGTPGSPAVVLEYDYVDANGRLTDTKAAVEGAYDFHNNYRYDALGRVTQLIQKGTGTPNAATVPEKRVDFQYNALGQRTAVTRYKNVAGTFQVARSAYGYDSANRLTSLTHQRGASTVASYAYEYDANDRITQFNLPNRSSESRAYTYDANGQVLSAGAEAFAYDAQGNRTGDGYGTLSENRIGTSPVDPSAPGGATYAYEYDFEGNITSRYTADAYEYGGQWWPAAVGGETADYSWDHRNRLTEVVVRTLPTEGGPHHQRRFLYTYDADDRRIGKEIQLDEDGDHVYVTESVERYVHDGADLVLVFNGNNGPLKHRYLHGPDVDEPLAEEDASNTTRWMLADHQGTVRDVVDSSGTGTAHIAYSAFGDVISPIDPLSAPRFGYTGREMDPETGLYFYRARYYEPTIGRFISQDPLEFDGGDSNLYRYVSNGPANARDPSGLLEEGHGARTSPYKFPWHSLSEVEDELKTHEGWWGGAYLTDKSPAGMGRHSNNRNDHYNYYVNHKKDLYEALKYYQELHRQRAADAQTAVMASGYDPSKEMASHGAYLGQGGLNAVQGLQNSVIGLLNLGITVSPTGSLLRLAGIDVSIPSPDWSQGVAANEYGSHSTNVTVSEVGWALASLKVPTPGSAAAAQKAGASAAAAKVPGASGWIARPEGTRIKQVGNYWIKEVNPEVSALKQWYARTSLNAQAKALDKLGDMAVSHLFANGKLIMRDAGKYVPGNYWRTKIAGSWRMRTIWNDIKPRNMGGPQNLIFDPALHPIHKATSWAGLGGVSGLAAGYLYQKYRTYAGEDPYQRPTTRPTTGPTTQDGGQR
jgi:RHS repeat-associated protein/uncharacterized delta-60 repeat protein